MVQGDESYMGTCQVCGKGRYYGEAQDHTECERQLSLAGRTPIQIERSHWEKERGKKSKRVIKRDGAICKICGVANNITIDHIIPIARGGLSNESNLQVLCASCNSRKGAS